jgi:hypothetical protein
VKRLVCIILGKLVCQARKCVHCTHKHIDIFDIDMATARFWIRLCVAAIADPILQQEQKQKKF